jgi:hypothetical protein
MLPADWLEYVERRRRELKLPPYPVKRRQPKVRRMQSRRQRIAESQTRDPIRAMYCTETQYNATPTKPEEWRGTRSPGETEARNYRAGKATTEAPFGYSKVPPRHRGTGSTRKPVKNSPRLDELLRQFKAGQ